MPSITGGILGWNIEIYSTPTDQFDWSVSWAYVKSRVKSISKYKLGYVKRGSTAFKVPKDGCGVPSAARALLGPEGLLMRWYHA